MHAIEVSNVSKIYRRYSRRRQFATLKSALLSRSLIRDLRPDETFPALSDVSFEVKRGSTFGVIGRNGSGKSTMLKLVAGITSPTSGSLRVNGRVSALIELGAGFHPEISGRENVFINGIMLGLSKKEITKRFDEIVEFAELQDFIDAPVKTYSSGMYMRLGFAVAIHVDPDILLVDEVLAVGDEAFAHKCLDKFGEFRRRGKTILLVTHSLGLVERFCDEALWLDHGRAQGQGDPKRIVGAYVLDVGKGEEALLAATDARAREAVDSSGPGPAPAEAPGDPTEPPPDMFKATEGRWGSREIEITGVTFLNARGEAAHVCASGAPMTIRLAINAERPVQDFVFGIGVFNADGVCCFGTNTDIEQYVGETVHGAGAVDFEIATLDLVEGTYKIDAAVHRRDGYPYDYHRLLYTFRVKSVIKDVGVFRPSHAWRFSPNVRLRRDTTTTVETPGGDEAPEP
ncbi:MAG: ABC transporter ATP-binding protein [Vicinamibacterales bacterium]